MTWMMLCDDCDVMWDGEHRKCWVCDRRGRAVYVVFSSGGMQIVTPPGVAA